MNVLHLEDDPNDAELVRCLISTEWPDCRVTGVAGRQAFFSELGRGPFDVILSDFALPSFDGFEALRLAKQHWPDTPFIFVSGTIGEDRAIEAVRLGAEDYVLKDRMKRLVTAITRAMRDAHERAKSRRAEGRIRELADCLNQAHEAVIVTDLEGRITFWNQGAEHLSGWSAAEALDCTSEHLFDSESAARIAEACKIASEIGEWAGELELRDRQGARRSAELRITVIRDDAGRPKARLVLATDTTERRLTEHRVREQAEMLNQAREAIFITDLENRILYWNAGAERLLGWPVAEALGKTAEQLMDPTVLAPIQAARKQTIETGQWYGELRMTHRNGDSLVVESRQTLIRDDAGRPKARLCINSDIT